MAVPSSCPLLRLIAVVVAATALPAVPCQVLGQVQKGSLERLGGPASLLRRPLSMVRDTSLRWLGHSWTLRLGAVGDTVCRVMAETFHSDVAGADSLSRSLSGLLAYELGEPLQEDCTTFRWSAADGEARYRFTEDAAGRRVTVTFTSNTATGAPRPSSDTGVVNLRVCFALCTARECGDSRVVLRQFERGGRRLALVLDPDSLDTEIAPLERLPVECSPWVGVRAALAGTRYALALADAERNETGLQDAGIVHAMPRGKGVVLTVDLCPSRRPLDRSLFDAVIAEFGPEERPVPLAVAVTGVWMEEHPDDVAWLLERVRRGDAAITWIDHSFSHRFEPGTPLTRNFLLEPGTNAEAEILRAEEAMLERGMVPSVFFRFPGLVSSRELFDRVVAHGLVPVGSDAWLAKGQRPTEGSIVLVHGNGNEPIGVEDFLRLLRAERGSIRERDWLLVDLRQSAVPEGIN